MKNENNEYNEYLVLGNDGLIDISSGSPKPAEYGDEERYSSDKKGNIAEGRAGKYNNARRSEKEKGKKGGKRTAVIISVAAAVVVVLGIAGFVVFNGFGKPQASPETEQQTAFTFTEKTVVSGIDITGKNLKQAKLLLELNKDRLVTPIRFSVTLKDEVKQLTQEDFSYTYDIDEVLTKAVNDIESGVKPEENQALSYEVTARVTEESINQNVSAICKETDTEPKNAYVTEFHPYAENRFEFAEATDGVKVDSKDLKEKIVNGFAGGNSACQITADIKSEPAEVDIEELSGKLVKLASYETYSTNTADGTTNMRVSLAACNGSIIEPGEVWSFNACTGDSNLAANGYKPASVIVEGKLEEGIGGGICQSSSTIYNAAIRANMEIEERTNHRWASSYVPTGFDATIDYPNLDLKLSNPTEYQMFLECKLVDSTLYATFWGVKTGDYDEIKTHNEISETGKKTYSVRAWRVYFKNGQEIDREELYKSSYSTEYGVVFIEADNDTKDVDRDVDDLQETTRATEASRATSATSAASKPNETTTAPKPTSKPTEPSSEVSETQEPVETNPPESESETEDIEA